MNIEYAIEILKMQTYEIKIQISQHKLWNAVK